MTIRNIRLSQKQERALEQGESGLSLLFWGVFALLVTVWLCHDTSAGLTASLERSHYNPFRSASTVDLIRDWF